MCLGFTFSGIVLTILLWSISYFCGMANFGNSFNVPVVVKNIIIINVIMVLAQFSLVSLNIDLGDYLALHHWLSPQFKWWQFFTYMFMHGSAHDVGGTLAHIFFNMYGLYMFGGILENIWGPKRFLAFYLICGLGAGLCHLGVMGIEFSWLQSAYTRYQQNQGFGGFMTFVKEAHLSGNNAMQQIMSFWQSHPDCSNCASESANYINEYYNAMLNTGVVGASGSIFGILFAFAYLFPSTELFIMFIPVPVKAKWAVAGYAVIELFSGIGRFQGDNVAHFAHLGGMLFAFIVLKVWQRNHNRFY